VNAAIGAAVRNHSKWLAEQAGLPPSYVDGQAELSRAERLAELPALKFGNFECFAELATDCAPSEVRLELDRARGTLHVRVDNRRESFLFEGVSPDARPFVNLWVRDDQVTLLP